MTAAAASYRLVACGLVVIAVACGRSPTGPERASGSSKPSADQTTFRIIDGWSQLPVGGAAVTANGTQALSDEAGQVQLPVLSSGCVVIDVKATGFLDRRTCGSSTATQIALWPVANADEEEATRKMVFVNDRIDGGFWTGPTQIALGPELAARADVAHTWEVAADTIETLTGGRIRFQWVGSVPEDGLVIEAASTPPSCSVAPPWPYEIGGFCVKYDPNVYFLDRLRVAPERLVDPATALRALLTEVGIKSHTLPGLMNAIRPEAGVSNFERKTLGMIGLRRRTVTWPDYDQIQ